MKFGHFIRDLFFTTSFFISWGFIALLFTLSYFLPSLFLISKAIFILLLVLTLVDFGILFFTKEKVECKRLVNDLLSNAEENTIKLIIKSNFPLQLYATIIDELPVQFQKRDFELKLKLSSESSIETSYHLKPTERGEYHFGAIHAYVSTRLQLIQRRFTSAEERSVKVYPSFLQLKKFQLKAIPDMQANSGGKRQFRRGLSTEFDHIKEYTRGDDARTINWKASARKNQFMINSFMDEKSQQVYCLIDKGRLMKMPFEQLTLLDYSINAALMFSYVALQKDDKIGLITFGEKINEVLQPSKAKKQFNYIMEVLYKQETQFLESNFADVYQLINKKAGQRSLLLLFTNFETFTGFERQLPYLKNLNQKHLLCVVLFENSEVTGLHEKRGDNLEDIYIKTIADKFIYEKKMIVKELQKIGILVVYTQPTKLSINVVNKYLELKARQFI
jgi:uncharacterized protein (DUF58 family)